MTPSVVRPLGARVLLLRDQTPQETRGGLVIPQRSQRRPQEGTVVACGPDVTDVAEGDRVLFGRFAGIPAGPYEVVWARDLMGVIEQETPDEHQALVRAAWDAYQEIVNRRPA